MRAALSDRGALLGDFGVGMGAALGGQPRRARIDTLGRKRWPSAGATLDLDFVAQQGYAYGQGLGRIRDLVAMSGGAGGTVVDRTGLLVASTAPRFDFDPVSFACKGLLIEEQRTNLIARSSQFDLSPWAKGGADVSITPNTTIARDGTLSADTLTATINEHAYGFTSALATSYSLGIDVLKTTGAAWFPMFVLVFQGGVAVSGQGFLNTNTGAFTQRSDVSVPVDSVLVEDARTYWRLTLTKASGNNTAGTVRLYASGNGGGGTFVGGTANSIVIANAQLEVAGFGTSVIPSVASAVTRTADSAQPTGFASLWNPTEGTLYVDFDVAAVSGTRPIVNIDNGTAAEQVSIYTSGTNLKATITAGGITQADMTLGTVAARTSYRAAVAMRAGEFSAAMNGGAEQRVFAGVMPVPSLWRIGADQVGNVQDGHARRQVYWPRRLSNLSALVS